MEIWLSPQAVSEIRMAADEAIEEGDTEALADEVYDAFPEAAIDKLEHLLKVDLGDMLVQLFSSWSGDDVDELLDLMEQHFGERSVDLKFGSPDHSADPDDDAYLPDDDA